MKWIGLSRGKDEMKDDRRGKGGGEAGGEGAGDGVGEGEKELVCPTIAMGMCDDDRSSHAIRDF